MFNGEVSLFFAILPHFLLWCHLLRLQKLRLNGTMKVLLMFPPCWDLDVRKHKRIILRKMQILQFQYEDSKDIQVVWSTGMRWISTNSLISSPSSSGESLLFAFPFVAEGVIKCEAPSSCMYMHAGELSPLVPGA